MIKAHSLHIPVMGLGFTMDTPAKVAQYGISSVISIGDDILIEKLRKAYCDRLNLPYEEINTKIEDYRAKRITAYLNLMNDLATKKFEEVKASTLEKGSEFKKYLDMLPDSSAIKREFLELTSKLPSIDAIKKWAKDSFTMGSIDVNIMTKVDQVNYKNGEKLPIEFNDAFAGIRGFANSDLSSSLIFSAGMNPRLYGYAESFDGFYPTKDGFIKKKIVLKVSDYRSAIIQGKFLAKKGLWVSEFRIESGLNCGGHAFATDGFLLGPILEEFKEKKDALRSEVFDILKAALVRKERVIPTEVLALKITAQGGVGTAEEHEFLLDHYQVDSVGWGTPFLLVPEATLVDDKTMDLLASAKEKDLYVSGISPLGIPFNSLRGNTKDAEKEALIAAGRPGSPCPRQFLTYNTEFTEKPICAASRKYQKLKIAELDNLALEQNQYDIAFNKIVEKSCLCVGLGTSAILVTGAKNTVEKQAVLVCPGPNMAYFDKQVSLEEMMGHAYGYNNVISRLDRPNMYIKELKMYIDYLKDKIKESKTEMNKKQEKYLTRFVNNMNDGVAYYKDLFIAAKEKFTDTKEQILVELDLSARIINLLGQEINQLVEEKKMEAVQKVEAK